MLDDIVCIEVQPCMRKVKCWNMEKPREGPESGKPPARQFHTASIIDHQMFVFGGGDGKFWLNELMVYNIPNNEWIGPVKTNGEQPSGRLQHAAVVHDKKLYIFGGEPDRYRQLNDLFYLDTTTMTWYQPKVEGIAPSPRVSVTGCLVNNTVYLFGGFDGNNWLSDLHTLDLTTNIWERRRTYGTTPTPRCRHSANYLQGKLFIFGGNDCDRSFNNIYTLWIEVHVPHTSLQSDMRKMLRDGTFADMEFELADGV